MNYWHIQLHPDNRKKFPIKKIREILKQTNYIGIGENWNKTIIGEFKDILQIGDIVLVRSNGPLALCKVVSNLEHRDAEDTNSDFDWFPNRRKVEILGWIEDYEKYIGRTVDNIYAPRTFASANNCEFIKKWYSVYRKNKMMENMQKLLEANKNLIFTGAPGTGKTYLAKQIAKQMIGVKTDEELEESGQFAFIQFHPSYDYTDFVEGLRPTKPDDNGNIGFELKDGVFKAFCRKAREKLSMTRLDDAIEAFKEECSDKTVKVKNKSGYEFSVTYRGGRTFRVRSDKSGAEEGQDFPANIESIKRLYQGIEEGIYNKTYVWGILEYLKKEYNIPEYQEDKSDKKYLFIIDEINRGEISKIFGELFFSVDPSYRGKKGAVETQYSNMHESNEKFYIPENVYIIGTMNDIDRSVESFDFAMRRRFTWEEITAEESAENMNLPKEIKDRMAKLNAKISDMEGLNASYHIGGAYFLDTDGKPRTDYETIWQFHLEPLLKEYLRGMSEIEKKLEELKNAYNAENNGQ